jgi:phenylpyruvate tautomerase PptA (4-oxalocrotonate tautomerase family)
MPLIEINALPQAETVDTANVARLLNGEIATALGCRLEAVWTVWRTIDGSYMQGAAVGRQQDPRTHAPIIHVFLHRTPEETARVVETIERVLTRELSLEPGNVFVTVQPVEVVEPGR